LSSLKSRADVQFEYFGISREDASPVIAAVERAFPRATVSERPTPPAASPPFSEFSVLLLSLSIAAHGFLSELGKDAYRGLRTAIIAAMAKARGVRDNRGGYVFGVCIEREDSYILFQCPEAPPPEQFEKALREIPRLVEKVPSGEFAEFLFDSERVTWGEPLLASGDVKEFLAKAMARGKAEAAKE
jgi:hypothetical protein